MIMADHSKDDLLGSYFIYIYMYLSFSYLSPALCLRRNSPFLLLSYFLAFSTSEANRKQKLQVINHNIFLFLRFGQY